MSKHILDHRDGREGGESRVEAFARLERETAAAGSDPKVEAMSRSRAEPAGDDPMRIEQFLRRARAD